MKKIINKFIFFTIFISIFSLNNVFWEWCEYKWQIDQCMATQNNSTQKSIEDFVCVSWNKATVAYQIILDMKFKEVDDKMDLYLEKLEKNKNTYFWIWAQKNYIDGINDIHDKSKEFKVEYNKLCTDIILNEALLCSEEEKVPTKEAIKYFNNNWTPCTNLVDKKISIFEDVAFGVLMLNKQQIKSDEKKTYNQWQRSNYDHLLDIMMINIWYVERIWQKWPSKLANPH